MIWLEVALLIVAWITIGAGWLLLVRARAVNREARGHIAEAQRLLDQVEARTRS